MLKKRKKNLGGGGGGGGGWWGWGGVVGGVGGARGGAQGGSWAASEVYKGQAQWVCRHSAFSGGVRGLQDALKSLQGASKATQTY